MVEPIPSLRGARRQPGAGDRLVILGCGNHGLVCGEMAELCGYRDISFLDLRRFHDPARTFPWRVRGAFETGTFASDLAACGNADGEFLVAMGDNQARLALSRQIEAAGLRLATLIHPTAFVSPRALVGAGSSVCAGAVIQPNARLGLACLVNTCASVDHDCQLAPGVHLSPGAHLSGRVVIGEGTWLGTGVAVRDGITIGSGITVGVGGVVVENLSAPGVYVGIPARFLRPQRARTHSEAPPG